MVNCLVHIRRHFEQALDENREMAEYGLTQIQKIYQIEHGCNDAGLSYEERKNKRQELARPILEAMKASSTAPDHRPAKPSHMPISDGTI